MTVILYILAKIFCFALLLGLIIMGVWIIGYGLGIFKDRP
jgi:hypothetical protein